MLLVCLSFGAFAQLRVEGEVSDAEGQPLTGASILIKGKTGGVSTNAQGRYAINVPDKNVTLIVSFLGFIQKEVPVNGQSTVNVVLLREESQLRSVVVTALGIKRQKGALGYAVSDIAAKDIAGFGETNPMASLAGKVAGVNVSGTTAGPTGSTRIVIRGIRELQGSNQPLYVIDGVPAVNGNIGNADQNGGFDLGDGLSDINPNDVESITVLKGASAAALYGSRALNGVILITTKSGKGKKGLGIEFSNTVTIDKINTKFDEVQKTYGQGSNGVPNRDASNASNIGSSWGPKYTELDSMIQRDGSKRPYKYRENHISDFFRSGVTVMNTLAVTGGNDKSSLRASYSNVSNKDIAPKSGFSRNNFAIRGETKVTDQLTLEAKGSLMFESVWNRPALTDDVNNMGNGLINIAGNFDQSWLQNYANADGSYINYTGDPYRANPYWTLNRTKNDSRKQRIGGSLNATYKFSDRLSATINAGTDFFNFNFENFYDKYTPTRDGGLLVMNDIKVREENYQAMINYNTRLTPDLKLDVMAGGNMMKYSWRQLAMEGKDIIQEGKSAINNFAQIVGRPSNPRRQINSVFGNVQFGYKDYLYLNVQGRNDWSSTLPKENRSYFYPSADLSFILTNAFDLKSDIVNYAKLRTSVGQVGGDTDPFQTNFTYSLTGTRLGESPMGEIMGDVVPNPHLKPQRKSSIELGADIGFLNDRIGLDFTWYHEVTKDAIVRLPIAPSSGYNFAMLNAADLKNSGVEILLRTTPLRLANGFRWDLSLNYSKNFNTITNLNNEVPTYTVSEARWAGASIIAEEGKAFGTILGKDFKRDAQGSIIHGGDGKPLYTDVQPIGVSLPDWSGGIVNSFSWKGFELKAVIDIRMGGDMLSMTNQVMVNSGQAPITEAGRESYNEWQRERRAAQNAGQDPDLVPRNGRGYIGVGVNEEGKPNDVPINPAEYWGNVSENAHTLNIYDASYVKLRDVGINYTLPKSLFKKLPVQSITVGVIGRNLWIIHKNTPNIDPESNYNNGNGQGFEYGSLPGRKRFGFNVFIKL